MDQKTQQPASDDASAPSEPVACARCGTAAESLPITWTCSVEGGVRRYFCDECARANIRGIEGRLDSAWW
ncbi:MULTISPECIES: hypothetical protein [Streptomyces]|uniref:Small CPxCG-related zinc finger protein n=1 Tax=Streptomyces silvisoli TaxID=3034235 RepID=A0ABT5ZIW4_9ACTN|nr:MULTISPECIES: hypothetical protein [Streptomyces]MDF3289509.1 hypothetical protein [Streptomyces silvisoli]